ncbi:hypothetical protein FBQ81_17580 [Chloroflexi bacterium CFX6]|nr:hypothetical protein [Chloroflexi bacterium CFX6]
MSEIDDQLVSELWARDVRFILGSKPDHPPKLAPAALIAALAKSREARMQLSLIPLFLRHPEFAAHAGKVSKKLSLERRLILKFFYSAAVWLERKHLSRNKLPDLFSVELGISPSSDPDGNLRALALRQGELGNSRINWLGTYQHAADIWLKDLELRKS